MPEVPTLTGRPEIIFAIGKLRQELKAWAVEANVNDDKLLFTSGQKTFTLQVVGEEGDHGVKTNQLPLDYLVRMPEKVAGFILAKLGLNRTVFARNCEPNPVDKTLAKEFLDRFHFMGSTDAAYALGLFHNEELLAVATFSKGRKMRRLREDERSFELIRFCTATGITVTGGLSKLMKAFCEKRRAAEIMTYVARQFSSGSAFLRAGFVLHDETGVRHFLIDRSDYRRIPFDGGDFDKKKFYLAHDAGNIKMLFVCRS